MSILADGTVTRIASAGQLKSKARKREPRVRKTFENHHLQELNFTSPVRQITRINVFICASYKVPIHEIEPKSITL